MILRDFTFEGRNYANVPAEILENSSRFVAKRRAINEGDLYLEEPSVTDLHLALAALVGSGLLEQYRTNPID